MTDSLTRAGSTTNARRLLEAAQRGDLGAQEELVRCYEPLVQRVVWKLRLPRGCDREDLAQEARVGLLAAIRAWRPERGPFPAFADRCVTNQALLALQAACAHKHQVLSLAISLDSPAERSASPGDGGRAPALLDTLAAPRDPRADPEARLLLREQLTGVLHALPELTASERAGLAMALNGQSYKRLPPPSAAPRKPRRRRPTGHVASSRQPSRKPPDWQPGRRSPGATSWTRGRQWALAGFAGQSPGGCRATNPAGPVPMVLHRGPVDGGLGGLPEPAAVSR